MIEKMCLFCGTPWGIVLTCFASVITIANCLRKVLRAIAEYVIVERFREYKSQRSKITERSDIDTGDDEQLGDGDPPRSTSNEQPLEEFTRQFSQDAWQARQSELVKNFDRQRLQPLKNFDRDRLERYMRN